MRLKTTTDVLIVGAGPTGLMLANILQLYDIDFILIDTKTGPTVESRALAVSARSMELYQYLGLSEEIHKRSVKVNGMQVFYHGRKKAEVSMQDLGEGLSDFSSMMTIFEQNKNETLLYEQIKDNDVRWETGFVRMEENPDHVAVTVQGPEGEYTIKTTYLAGCGGASSPVRKAVGFAFEGGTYENKFYVADAILTGPVKRDRVTLAPSDRTFAGFFPMEGEDRYRIVGTLPYHYADREDITFDDIESSVLEDLRLPLEIREVNWFSVYKLHHRCVNTFSAGRIHLAGDAAHIHSPAGGQGMNTGLQDALNLGWKLAYVLKGWAKDELLDTYDEERLPFAQWLLRFTDRGFTFLAGSKLWQRLFRRYFALNMISRAFRQKPVRKGVFMQISQIAYSHFGRSLSHDDARFNNTVKFRVGDRFPWLRKGMYLRYRSPGFHLVHISDSPLAEQESAKFCDLFPFPVKYINEPREDWQAKGLYEDLFILLRPDHYIAYMAKSIEPDKINQYLSRYFNV